jgi:hypothetical protein
VPARFQRPLREPIVLDSLGKMYNKDAILEFLLDRSSVGDGESICGHVKSMKVRSSCLSTCETLMAR